MGGDGGGDGGGGGRVWDGVGRVIPIVVPFFSVGGAEGSGVAWSLWSVASGC